MKVRTFTLLQNDCIDSCWFVGIDTTKLEKDFQKFKLLRLHHDTNLIEHQEALRLIHQIDSDWWKLRSDIAAVMYFCDKLHKPAVNDLKRAQRGVKRARDQIGRALLEYRKVHGLY